MEEPNGVLSRHVTASALAFPHANVDAGRIARIVEITGDLALYHSSGNNEFQNTWSLNGNDGTSVLSWPSDISIDRDWFRTPMRTRVALLSL